MLLLTALGVAPAAQIDPGSASQVAKLTASDGAANNLFGLSVAVSGDTAVVGAHWASPNGAAYVFQRDQGGTGAWGQVTRLIPSDADYFGARVAISGDTIVVSGSDSDSEIGSAYLFYRNQGGADAWGQVAKLVASDGARNDDFGSAVAIAGDTVVIGAPKADLPGAFDQGAVYVFYRNQGGTNAWGQAAKLTAVDAAGQDHFGHAAAIDGDVVVVSADQDDVGFENNQGAAYVFYRNQGGADAWGQVAKLVASDGAEDDYFGNSVSISGDLAIVGAEYAHVSGHEHQGAAYLYQRNQGGLDVWGQVKKLTAADGYEYDHFGNAVAIDGDMVAVGAYYAYVGANWNQGVVYLFARDQGGAGTWGQVAELAAADGAAADQFGCSVATRGGLVVAGAWLADVGGNVDQGAAYVFRFGPYRVYLPVLVK